MKHQDKPISFSDLALALANDYFQLFVINNEDDSYVEYSAKGTDKALVQVSQGSNFYEDVPHNCREQVYEEDQAYFLETFRKENVIRSLENGKSFTLTYRLVIDGEPRYFFLKTIRANDRSIIIGVQDIDAQMRKELAAASASRTYSDIASSLASLFEVIYYIDLKTGYFKEFAASESYAKLGFMRDGANFFAQAKHDLEMVIHPEDRPMLLRALERDLLLEHILRSGSYSVTYRQLVDGRQQYMNLLAFLQKDDSLHLVIGVRNIDVQIRQQSASEQYSQIAGALASRYEAIYYVNVDTNAYVQYSASDEFARLGTMKEGVDFFEDVVADIQNIIHPDDRTHLLGQLKKENLLENLFHGSLSLSYRQFLDGRQQYMSMIAVMPKNDVHHVILGVLNTDAQVRHELSIRAQTQTFSDISRALAQRYEVIYHVNICTNEYTEYSASDKYARLQSGVRGSDFFADTQVNMQKEIYPDDLPMMQLSMQKENLLGSLSGGKMFLNYRLMLDGRPQYVSLYAVRPKEDSEHIIIAVANVDAAKRMELAYKDAVDMANRDALTGVKNKRAYAQAEADLDEQIRQDKTTPFAIAVCDVNGLKQVNDTHGHKVGDDFIRSACSIICNTFKHSPVFRIGGDEFAVLLKGQDYLNRMELMHSLEEVLDEHRHNGVVLLAAGISDYLPEQDMRVQDVFERADTLMYANKEMCKTFGKTPELSD